jgi:hypothetical protein
MTTPRRALLGTLWGRLACIALGRLDYRLAFFLSKRSKFLPTARFGIRHAEVGQLRNSMVRFRSSVSTPGVALAPFSHFAEHLSASDLCSLADIRSVVKKSSVMGNKLPAMVRTGAPVVSMSFSSHRFGLSALSGHRYPTSWT